MSRPRLTIGTYGEITTRRRPSGRIEARARYRDWDGATRLVQASGDTAAAATHALKAKCVDRNLIAPSAGSLTADSPFPELVAYWLEDIDLEDRLATGTRQLYERDMRTLVLPVFKDLTLREIGVARCDQFLKRLAKGSYSKAKHARVVLRLALALAVRHEVLLRNPVDHVARLHRDARVPDAFTPEEITAIRAAISYWEVGREISGPKPDGQLGAIVEVMLGTSARIGEVLAIRRRDIDLSMPSVRITGTIISPKGEPTTRQDHPKTARSRRTIQLPGFAATAVQRRLKLLNTIDPDALLFCSREGTPLTTNNVRRQLRHVMNLAGIEGVTPHKFRRTVATTINEQAGVELASQLLGHTDPEITIKHYIRRNETVDPTTAGFARRGVRMKGLVIKNSNRYAVCVTSSARMEVNMDAALLPDLLGYKDLADAGLTRRQFDRLIDAEEYERIAPGQFLRAGATDDTTAAWMAIAAKRPQATLCLLTALSIHDLTDEIPTRSNIAIPRGTKPLTIWSAPITWHHFDTATFDIGRTEYALPGGRTIGLYSAERTIVDLFRLSHEWGSDLAIDALKRWLRVRGNSPSGLLAMVQGFPKGKPSLQNALEILL